MSETTIRITTDADSIVFSGDDITGGYIYDDKSLDLWYSNPETRVDTASRSNAHGDFTPDQNFTEGARPSFTGKYFGPDRITAAQARNRLAGLFNDGKIATAMVTDLLGTTTRQVFVRVDLPWTPHQQFTFTIDLYAPDPRRYGPATYAGPQTVPAPSTGLTWPLGSTSPFFNWGTTPNSGSVSVTNTGNTTAYPIINVGDGGNFGSGFRLTEIETGRELTFNTSTGGAVITLNNNTRRATRGSADVTDSMSSRKWFSIPAGATRSYQISALGTVTGTPTFTVTLQPAYL